jgi:hypothetical protein
LANSVIEHRGEYSLSGYVLRQVVRTVESLSAPGICASILFPRLVAKLMPSAMFGSGKDLFKLIPQPINLVLG